MRINEVTYEKLKTPLQINDNLKQDNSLVAEVKNKVNTENKCNVLQTNTAFGT